MKFVGVLAVIGFTAFSSMPLAAAEFQVKMLNKGSDGSAMVFEPAFLHVAAGDTVTFVPADKGHNAEVINGMSPVGAEAFKGKLSEQFSVTFATEGAYGYKCLPHLGMGMVGLIVVGDNPSNLDAIKQAKVPPKAREKFDALIAQVGK